MKYLILLTLSIIVFHFSFAQTIDNNNNLKIKAYTNFRYDENRDLLYDEGVLSNIEQNNFVFGKLSIAVENNFSTRWAQEIEFSLVDFKKDKHFQTDYDPSNLTVTTSPENKSSFKFEIYSRYQIHYYILDPESKFQITVGAATGLRYSLISSKPLENTSYQKTYNTFTIPFEAVLGFDYKLSDSFTLNLSIPTEINNLILEHTKTIIPYQSNGTYNSNDIYGILMPKSFNLKLGLSYKL